MRFDVLEPHQGVQGAYALAQGGSRTYVTNLSTPCYLCHVVARIGSMRFGVLEPPRISA